MVNVLVGTIDLCHETPRSVTFTLPEMLTVYEGTIDLYHKTPHSVTLTLPEGHKVNSFVCWLVAYRLSNMLCVSEGWICSDNFTYCHTEKEVADQTVSPGHSILTPGQPVPALTQ